MKNKLRIEKKGQINLRYILSSFGLAVALGIAAYILTMVTSAMKGGTGEGSVGLAVVVAILTFVFMMLLAGWLKGEEE